jgi:hypothetical protein
MKLSEFVVQVEVVEHSHAPRFPKILFHGLRDGLLLITFLHSWAMHKDEQRRSYKSLLLSTPDKKYI